MTLVSYYKPPAIWCIIFKACPHWTPNAHWTGSNPVWARPHWMRIRPIRIRSGLIPIHFQRWFRSGLNWIAQLRVARKDQKGRGVHATDSERASLGYTLCSTYLLHSRRLAEAKIWWRRHGSCVEVWPLEVNVHAWIRFPHNAVWTWSLRIGFALNSHWAIRLLNQFESGFSVDRPLVGISRFDLYL